MGRVLFHTILVFLTGGLWLVVLGVKFLLDNSGRKRRYRY